MTIRSRFLSVWRIPHLLWFCLSSQLVGAQVLDANDDAYGVSSGEPLVVDTPGVMDNDLLDGESAGEQGAVAFLISDVGGGVLTFRPDGSFSYTPGPGFTGIDGFTYRISSGSVSADATVTLTACTGDGPYWACWKEAAFLAKADELGFTDRYSEGFEDDEVWAEARLPLEAVSVVSQGIQWQANHPEPPASNLIATGPGAAYTGNYGVFDREHGYAENLSASQCNGDQPPPECLWHDGFTGIRLPALAPLNGVGGYIRGILSGKIAIVVDDAHEVVIGPTPHAEFAFFGVIDTAPAGFMRFEFRELDGKSDQRINIFGDEVTLLGKAPAGPVVAAAPALIVPLLNLLLD